MADEIVTTPQTQEPPEHMIPKSRFDEINTERQKLAEKIAQIEADQKAETEKRLAEQSKFQELAENRGKELVEAQAKASKVESYEKTLQDVLTAQVESLPEDKRGLIPDELTTQQKLSWLAKNSAILKAPAAFDIGAGRTGGNGSSTVVLSPEEMETAKKFKISPEEYSKYR
jgi:ribonucleoside-triphosphate reductase